jgi:adenosylcobinamide-GDP ribazoletransferase
MLNRQLNLFLIALAFFSRIPVSAKVDFNQQNLNHASRYFSAVGFLIGSLTAASIYLLHFILPLELCLLLSMLLSVFLTGCFHEDGLADTCDGFGGGWKTQQKLEIMKDSRLGTYGATAIWFALSLKFYLLLQIAQSNFILLLVALVISHSLSRWISTAIIYLLPYVSDSKQSKSKPLAEKLQTKDLIINSLIALLTLVLLLLLLAFVGLNSLKEFMTLMGLIKLSGFIITAAILSGIIMRHIMRKQIQGFTGDTLGATQQVSELMIYLSIIMAGPWL